MSTELELFDYSGHEVRTAMIDGEPWVVAQDVAAVLALGNFHSSLAALDEDEKGVHTVETPGGPQSLSVVNEPGLYSLILRSRKPEAKAFKRWITHEVLPQLRKTGVYATTDKAEVTTREKSEALALLQYQTRASRQEARELAKQGLDRNPVTGSLEVRPGVVLKEGLKDEVPKLVEQVVQERSRQAKRSYDRGNETPAEFRRNEAWQGLEAGEN